MVTASLLPANEAERLTSLHHYNILHSPPEDVFDQLVALSARLFGLPIAYILLLNAEQGHFKATHGLSLLPPPPRQKLLCAQVVRQGQVVVYHDLAVAPQVLPDAQAIEYALSQQLRFYAGAPLRMPDQHTIGTLCVGDQQPRSFSPHEQAVLEKLASVVSQAVVVRHQLLQNPTLDETQWHELCAEARDEVHQLALLVRYLLVRYPKVVPVPEAVLQLVSRRLRDLAELLDDRT